MEVSPSELLPEIGSLDGLFENQHAAAFGITRSGKTYFCRRIYTDTSLRGIFWNPEEEPVGGVRCRPKNVARQLAQGYRRIDVRPPVDNDERKAEFTRMAAQIMKIGDRLKGNKDKTPPWLLVVVDEAQIIADKHGAYGALHDLMARGQKRGIRVLVASQRPARVPQEVLTQAKVHFLFETQWEDAYFKRYGVPLEEFADWVAKPYHFVAVRGARFAKFRPVRSL